MQKQRRPGSKKPRPFASQNPDPSTQKLRKLDQQIFKLTRKKDLMERALPSHPANERRARTRTLIQLGGLIEKAGILDRLAIPLGSDLQQDPDLKNAVMILMGTLVDVRQNLDDNLYSKTLLLQRGKEAFGENS